ncbi:MAG TPA: cyclic nucleotide-binding domain-containing protein [Candidatus Dormibacteraeota bacterium]|nr:cyclic nucleotide-binding domain-containing protein [Candidatus Dormibacteraeota bacterium]
MVETLRQGDPGLDWFGTELPADVTKRLGELATVRRYAPGSEIFREGEEAREFGIVRAGRVALRVLVPERGMVTILTVEPGDVIGWSAVVAPYRSTSTAEALETAEVVSFDGAALRGVLRSDARLAAIVYPRLLQAVARRLVGTRYQLLDLFASEENAPW